MKLSREQIDYIAELARLDLSEEEKALYQEQLSVILEYFDRIQELDTESIPPTSTVLPMHNVMRADESVSSSSQEDILKNAPDSDGGYFKVPPVLE